MTVRLSLSDALRSGKLFGPFFAGPSWDTWRAVLKAAFAEPLTPAELATFREVAEREPPQRRVRELVAIVGRGGGKDSVASLIAAHVAVSFNPKGKLRPGEKAVVMIIAVDRDQAKIARGYIAAFFNMVPTLRALVRSVKQGVITLNNGVVIEVHTRSYRSVRGRSILCAIMDEVSFWAADELSATPDTEVYGAVRPGLARVPQSMAILISSAHKRSGLLYQRWRDYFGKNDDDVLVVKGSTLQFNPTFDADIIEKDIASDPQLYRAEYLSEWRDDLSTFISRELIEAAVDRGVRVRPPLPKQRYFAFADPSGGVGDSFSAAIAHRESEAAFLDVLYERKPPFNPSEVVAEVAALIRQYRCSQIVGDKYAAMWVIEAFRKAGATYEHSERDRSAIYLDVLPLFTSGRAHLIDHARCIAQFVALERRTSSVGKDKIDHGTHGHDDLCNAAAGALVAAAARSQHFVVTAQVLEMARRPPRYRRPRLGEMSHF